MRAFVLLFLAVTACAPAAPTPAVNPPPPWTVSQGPSVPMPLRLVGTEPFWGVLLKDGSLSFNGVDRGAIVAPIATVRAENGGLVFVTPPPTRVFPASVRATVTPGACSDGMSKRTYPYAAVVDIDYAGKSPPVTLRGCAGPESLFEPPDRQRGATHAPSLRGMVL